MPGTDARLPGPGINKQRKYINASIFVLKLYYLVNNARRWEGYQK